MKSFNQFVSHFASWFYGKFGKSKADRSTFIATEFAGTGIVNPYENRTWTRRQWAKRKRKRQISARSRMVNYFRAR